MNTALNRLLSPRGRSSYRGQNCTANSIAEGQTSSALVLPALMQSPFRAARRQRAWWYGALVILGLIFSPGAHAQAASYGYCASQMRTDVSEQEAAGFPAYTVWQPTGATGGGCCGVSYGSHLGILGFGFGGTIRYVSLLVEAPPRTLGGGLLLVREAQAAEVKTPVALIMIPIA
jgi:hypothetical protein